jgi:hypothetical protein
MRYKMGSQDSGLPGGMTYHSPRERTTTTATLTRRFICTFQSMGIGRSAIARSAKMLKPGFVSISSVSKIILQDDVVKMLIPALR